MQRDLDDELLGLIKLADTLRCALKNVSPCPERTLLLEQLATLTAHRSRLLAEKVTQLRLGDKRLLLNAEISELETTLLLRRLRSIKHDR